MLTTVVLLASLGGSNSAPIISPIPLIQIPFATFSRQLPCNHTAESYELFVYFATIFASAWVTVHPNVPHPLDSGWMRFKQQTALFLCALVAPELVLCWAWNERRAAKKAVKEFNAQAYGYVTTDEISWLTRVRDYINEWFYGPEQTKSSVWTLTHGFFVGMGGFVLYEGKYPLYPLTLAELTEGGKVDLPIVSNAEIADRSKEDFLTRLLFLQALWFVRRCLTQELINQFDVVTLAYLGINAITYVLWWQKPQNVGVGVRVQLKKSASKGSPKSQAHGEKTEVTTKKEMQ